MDHPVFARTGSARLIPKNMVYTDACMNLYTSDAPIESHLIRKYLAYAFDRFTFLTLQEVSNNVRFDFTVMRFYDKHSDN